MLKNSGFKISRFNKDNQTRSHIAYSKVKKTKKAKKKKGSKKLSKKELKLKKSIIKAKSNLMVKRLVLCQRKAP